MDEFTVFNTCTCGMRVLMLFLFNIVLCFFFFKQKTAYEMRISDWSSDVCSSDLTEQALRPQATIAQQQRRAQQLAVEAWRLAVPLQAPAGQQADRKSVV